MFWTPCWAGKHESLLQTHLTRRPSSKYSPPAPPQPHPCLCRCRAGPTRQPSPTPPLLTFSSSLSPEPVNPAVRQAGDALGVPAERPARRGPERAHREPIRPREGGKDLNAPHREHLRTGRAAATGSTCPYPANGRGHWGKFVPGCLRPPFKRGARQAWHGRQATNPFGVFHSPPPCSRRLGERRERAAAASRRTREEPGPGAGTPTSPGTSSTRQGHHLQPPLVGRGKSRPRRGREPDRSRDPYIAGNASSPRHLRSRPGYDYTAAPT
jgi:hypothetical protein